MGKSCPNEKLLAPMNFSHARSWFVGLLLLQLCATGAKWHPAKAQQQQQFGVCPPARLPACQSVRLSIRLTAC